MESNTHSLPSIHILCTELQQFVQTRIEIQQQYMQSLMKLSNKLPHIKTFNSREEQNDSNLNNNQCYRILKSFKAIHSEKIHQAGHYIKQIRQEKQNYCAAINQIKNNKSLNGNNINQGNQGQTPTQKQNKDPQKVMNEAEKNLKITLQKMGRLQKKVEQQIRINDEKLLVEELGSLKNKKKGKVNQLSLNTINLVKHEHHLILQTEKQYGVLKQEAQKHMKKLRKYDKMIKEQESKIQIQIMDFVKKFIIEEVSILRNLQYDVDNFIKKTNIFELQQKLDISPTKKSKHTAVRSAKQTLQRGLNMVNYFAKIKQQILKSDLKTLKDQQSLTNQPIIKIDKEYISMPNQQLQKNLNAENQPQTILDPLIAYFEQFRNNSQCKFQRQAFTNLQIIFAYLLKHCFSARNFSKIYQLIIYAHIYQLKDNKAQKVGEMNTCVLEVVNAHNKSTLNQLFFMLDINFWKFLLYYAIREAVIEINVSQEQQQMHINNNVFSVLISNSLNMIICGLDKYSIRNTLMKYAKIFKLYQNQTEDLLRFIDHNYDQYHQK